MVGKSSFFFILIFVLFFSYLFLGFTGVIFVTILYFLGAKIFPEIKIKNKHNGKQIKISEERSNIDVYFQQGYVKNKEEFTTFFESKIRSVYEGEVLEIKKIIKSNKILIGIIIFVFVFTAIFVSKVWAVIGFFIIVALLVISGYISPPKPMIPIEVRKGIILNAILSEVVPSFTFNNEKSITEEEFENYYFISPSKMDHFESSECVLGNFKGYETKISEIELSRKNEINNIISYVKVFQGLIIEMDIDSNPEYHLVVANKSFKDDVTRGLVEVSLSNVYLDEKYFILTSDLIKTNKILEPRHLEKISKLLEQDEHKISIGFSNGKFVVLVNNESNFFEIFNEGRFEPDVIWDEIINIFKYVKWVENLEIDFSEIR
jgi:hypothetical protein